MSMDRDIQKLQLDVMDTKNQLRYLCISLQKIEKKVDKLFLYILTGLGTLTIIFLTALIHLLK
jgi:hypothetical protein